jgi:hypothetical protein
MFPIVSGDQLFQYEQTRFCLVEADHPLAQFPSQSEFKQFPYLKPFVDLPKDKFIRHVQ